MIIPALGPNRRHRLRAITANKRLRGNPLPRYKRMPRVLRTVDLTGTKDPADQIPQVLVAIAGRRRCAGGVAVRDAGVAHVVVGSAAKSVSEGRCPVLALNGTNRLSKAAGQHRELSGVSLEQLSRPETVYRPSSARRHTGGISGEYITYEVCARYPQLYFSHSGDI